MARHIDGLYLITKEYEQNKNVEDCYHRLAGLCDAIMKIDDFPFDLDQFTVDEKGKFINKFIEILESDKPYIKNIWEAKAGKKLPNKKICYTLKKEDVDNTLDSLMKAQNISINKLAFRAEMQRTQLKAYIKGDIQRLDMDVLSRLCYALECTLDDLIEYVPPNPH